MPSQDALRSIPSIEVLLGSFPVKVLVEHHGRELVTYACRRVLEDVRAELAGGRKNFDEAKVVKRIDALVRSIASPSLRQVINATGIVVHTNLGRSPLGKAVVDELAGVATGYCNLEFDLDKGRRGHRAAHVREVLRYLTGAEDVVVVNNNAAGLILVLGTLARRKEVVVSRGELIEIGGAFRIPEIMSASGARMVEVGTTNRTRLTDYEEAISGKTALLFKAHCSNYTVSGFTETTSVRELSKLGASRLLPMVYDIGSGLLRKPGVSPLQKEPDVRAALADGADLVTFSCDKLLGGPQAGIVAGRTDLVRRLSKAPLMRALRVGKLTLAALSAACRHYLSDEALCRGNPAFSMFTADPSALQRKAENLRAGLEHKGIPCRVVGNRGHAGGGSLPDETLESYAVELTPPANTVRENQRFAEKIHRGLLNLDRPVLSILREGRVLLDILTVLDGDLQYVSDSVVTLVG